MNATTHQGPQAAEVEELLRLAPAAHVPELSDDRRRALRRFLMNEIDPSTPAVTAANHRSHRRLFASVAIVLVLAVLAGGVILAGRHAATELRYPATASAAEVAANVRSALSSIRTLRADETGYFKVVKGPPKSKWRRGWTTADWWARARIYSDEEFDSLGLENGSPYFPTRKIVVTADGRWRVDSPEDDPATVVDQSGGDDAAGVTKVYWPSAGRRGTVYVGTDVSLGPPDDPPGMYGGGSPLQFIRPATLAAMAHGRVSKTTADGRPCLTVSCAIAPVPIKRLDMDSEYFDTVTFTVDRETWLIVRTSYLLRGQVVWEQRLTNVRVNEPASDAQVEPAYPDWTKVKVKSLDFRRVSFDEAGHVFSTRPLEPRALPSGFRPFAAAVAETAKFSYYTEPDGKQARYWPASRDVTQLSYRAGLLRFVVTTREQPSGGPLPADPLVADPFVRDSATDDMSVETMVKLTGGAWHGVTVHLVTPLLDFPHLWAWHDGRLVTIGGDLTRSQLLAVANSLEPMK